MIAAAWSVAWAIIQLVVFSGQMNYVQIELSVVHGRKYPTSTPFIKVNDGSIQYPGDNWKYYYSTPEQRFYTGLYILQIFILALSALVICAVPCFVYGFAQVSQFMIWPWFIVILASVLCSFAYCVMWWSWAPDARGSRLTLTVLEFVMGLANIAMLLVTVILHRKYVKNNKALPVHV